MRVLISGANGFVGKALVENFKNLGFEVRGLNREDLALSAQEFAKKFDGFDTVINLAGANIAQKWTQEYKKLLYSSRIDTTKKLVDSFALMENKPKLFISTSAVGIYGEGGIMDEFSSQFSSDYLAHICKDWEAQALRGKEFVQRVAIFRFGVVLGRGGGALEKMILPFKFGLGGTIGDGSQGFSWIHIKDLVNTYNFMQNNTNLDGIFNICAPNPTTNQGLTKALSGVLHRPAFFKVPKFILELQLGEGSKVLLDGQKVVSKRLKDEGFLFEFPTIDEALKDIINIHN